MYGLPGQNMEILKNSVEKAIELAPQHISIYGLQVEEARPSNGTRKKESWPCKPRQTLRPCTTT
jgi:oxygen-independent coproporphyrinogen-3 oxidase